jgi:hypothetical protein
MYCRFQNLVSLLQILQFPMTYQRKDGQTDMTKQIVSFSNLANTLKISTDSTRNGSYAYCHAHTQKGAGLFRFTVEGRSCFRLNGGVINPGLMTSNKTCT